MKYRVLDGYRVTWPDGSTRAAPGDVFESFEGDKDPVVAARARVLLRGQRAGIVRVADSESATVGAAPWFDDEPKRTRQIKKATKKRASRRELPSEVDE